MSRRPLALSALASIALAFTVVTAARPAAAPPPVEIRALWVLRSSLATPGSIAHLIATATTYGFNTLLVQVRGRGDAYYASQLEPRADDLQDQPAAFDPLAALLPAAHAAGLRVHAWVNVDLVSSAFGLPTSPDHIVYRHPEWLMVPRALAREMIDVDIASPAYVGRLARWTRTQSNDVEGLYASPITPGAAAHVTAVISDLAARYALDGVHLDYLRFPDERFDYSRFALDAFRDDVLPTLAGAERQQLEAALQTDPTALVDALPDQWARFRRS
jgi:uncharacterized lipoprotein YddW (UPF0748 family)